MQRLLKKIFLLCFLSKALFKFPNQFVIFFIQRYAADKHKKHIQAGNYSDANKTCAELLYAINKE